jgi:hypothetical protein
MYLHITIHPVEVTLEIMNRLSVRESDISPMGALLSLGETSAIMLHWAKQPTGEKTSFFLNLIF